MSNSRQNNPGPEKHSLCFLSVPEKKLQNLCVKCGKQYKSREVLKKILYIPFKRSIGKGSDIIHPNPLPERLSIQFTINN
jgi:hypothetical protein